MNKNIHLIYLLLLATVHFSCIEKKSTEKTTTLPKLAVASQSNVLRFTSAIRAIFQDSKGNYWIGSHSEGVCCYNGKTFAYYTVTEGLADNQIRSIQEDKNGKIWLSTANGISVYADGFFTNYPAKNNTPQPDWQSTQGDLWFYSWEEDGINRFDGEHMHYLTFPKPKKTTSNSSFGVTGISKSKDGTIWIATYAALYHYDYHKLQLFDAEKLNLKDTEQLHIRSVLADSKGRIWIGNNGIGVVVLEGNSVVNFSEKNSLIAPMRSRQGDQKTQPGTLEHPFAIAEDSEGSIWFGDVYTGAWKYDGKTMTNYSVSTNPAQPMIWTIYKDKRNHLLFGLADGSIYRFNGKTFDLYFQ